jgi:hypothetical protein
MEGHTKGSIGLLIKEHKLLFTGDAAISMIWMFLKESTSKETYIKMLQRVKELDFTHFITGHLMTVFEKKFFDYYLEVATTATPEPETTTEPPIERTKVVIDPLTESPFNGGKFEGWGTSLCWWANRLGYSDSLAEQAATLFSNKEAGLGMNIARYNIGGGDDPTHTHITRTDSKMPGFTYYNEEY